MDDPLAKADRSKAERLMRAGLEVLVATDAEYVVRQESYWSNNAKVNPACIVRPKNAEDVSTTIKTLVSAGEKFAVRSGGHMQYAGSNNIEGGVTIDLALLNWTRYDDGSETVDIGPGGRWSMVYTELEKHGRVVAGGRDGNVGVAGLLLGGGKTFFTARRGFGCDDVVAYEVVLADGRTITADVTNNDDLFRALKGGSNNFGIVTNFKMKAFVCNKIWGGLTIFPKHVIPAATQALSDFTGSVKDDLDSNLLCFFTYTGSYPDFRDIVIVAAYVQVTGIEKAHAYDKWLALPTILTTCKSSTVSQVVNEYNIAPQDYHNTFFTHSFKNDTRVVAKASWLHEKLVEELKVLIPDGNFVTQCLFQPLPRIYGQRSAEAGGNIMGVEEQPSDGLLFVAVAMVKTPDLQTLVYPKIKAWVEAVHSFAETIDGNLDWVYLNYADASQDPLASYGTENMKTMREVAAKYDPQRVFQELCPGGFKLAGVKAQN